jgi:predicted ribosomally synthesized peptide with SipW-like signal peptide
MAYSRKFLTVGAMGVAAFALIGAGATASFNDSVDATQKVTAGTMSLRVTSPGARTSGDGRTVTLPNVGPVSSTFETHNNLITVTNNGNIPVASLEFQMKESHTDTNASIALVSQLNVCIKSHDFSGTWVEGNGPLRNGVSLFPSVSQNPIPLAVGESLTYSVDFYAGQDSTTTLGTGTPGAAGSGVGAIKCGKVGSDSARQSALWNDGGAYQTPKSLTNAAMGGVVTPTLTFKFTG